jgi:hypothetical protein
MNERNWVMSNNEKYVCVNCVEQIAEKDAENERLRGLLKRKNYLTLERESNAPQIHNAQNPRLRWAIIKAEFVKMKREIKFLSSSLRKRADQIKRLRGSSERNEQLLDANARLWAENTRLRGLIGRSLWEEVGDE